jgi:hypothetical protein
MYSKYHSISTIQNIQNILYIRNVYNSISISIILTILLDEPDIKTCTEFFIFSTMFIFYTCELEQNNKLLNL